MNVLDRNWITDAPFDFELKRYKLLAATAKLTSMVRTGYIYDSLLEVEIQLEDLYKLKNERNEIDNRLRVLKGIDLDNMSLDYEYPDASGELNHIYQICDLAIEEFEAVFRLIRATWRSYAKKLTISEIPQSMPTKTKGVVFIINKKDSSIIPYSYFKPSSFIGEWKDMVLKPIDSVIGSNQEMISYIQNSRIVKDDNRFWRCDYNLSEDLESCILPIIQHTLYHKILIR